MSIEEASCGRSQVGIAIFSSDRASRDAVRDTWMPLARDAGVLVRFIIESVPPDGDPGSYILVEANDGKWSPEVIAKVVSGMEAEWVFGCFDNTYVVPARLVKACLAAPPLDTQPLMGMGALSLLSGDGINFGGGHPNCSGVTCDQILGNSIRLHANPNGMKIPRQDNEIIACRLFSPSALRNVHSIFTLVPEGCIDAVDCHGKLTRFKLFEVGTFCTEEQHVFGSWKLDSESNLWVEFQNRSDQPVLPIPVAKLLPPSADERQRIGILVVATGNYRRFVWRLLNSIRLNFLPGHEKTMILFTDAPCPPAPDLEVFRIAHRPWPEITLFRYSIFRDHEQKLKEFDYLFYIDVDSSIEGPVGNEILDDLVAVIHPHYANTPPARLPYERDRDSIACILENEGNNYYCGGFQGGSSSTYVAAAVEIARHIDSDWERGKVATWHDESHWNRYLINRPPSRSLSASYCYPESSDLPLPRKIIALDKNHDTIRREGCNEIPSTIVAMLSHGLGNQMFQYAAAFTLARRLCCQLELLYVPGDRKFALSKFGIPLATDSQDQGRRVFCDHAGYRAGLEMVLHQAVARAPFPKVSISGHFQNEAFFEEMAEEIRNKFHLEPRLPALLKSDATPVAIQVRKGDYVGNSKHDLCTPAYYLDAMSIVRALLPTPVFYVISDDLEWCHSFFAEATDVFVPRAQNEWEGMQTMLACQGHIISNSTYGWWGAWLSDSKVVVAPDPFVSDRSWEIVPSRWIRIPAGGVRDEQNAL